MRVFAFFAIAGAMIRFAAAQDAPPTIEQMLAAANASYLHHDYTASLSLYQQARRAIDRTAPQNPQRYDVLKRLAAVSGAKGDYKAAIDYLQNAIEWRWEQVSKNDPAALTDRIQQVNFYRAMEDFEQARTVLLAVMSKHQGLSGFRSLDLAGDYSLMGQVYMDEKNTRPQPSNWRAPTRFAAQSPANWMFQWCPISTVWAPFTWRSTRTIRPRPYSAARW